MLKFIHNKKKFYDNSDAYELVRYKLLAKRIKIAREAVLFLRDRVEKDEGSSCK